MSAATSAVRTESLTVQEALDWERAQPERYEFDGFQMVAMTDESLEHAEAVSVCRDRLRQQLPRSCRVYTESMKLQCESTFRYPDVMVFCDRLPGRTADTLPAADLALEVISKHSARRDRVEKPAEYAARATTYVVIDTTARSIEYLIGSASTMPQGAVLDSDLFDESDAAFAGGA